MLKLKIAADAFADRKRRLLRENGLTAKHDVLQGAAIDALRIARLVSLSEDELYFLQPNETFHQQLNPRNEAAALSGLLDQLSKQLGQYPEFELWLKEHCQGYAADSQAEGSRVSQEAKLPNVFDRWAQENSVQTLLHPGFFHNNIRGLSAAEDLEAGAVAVRVPEELLISQETAKQSDLGPVLMRFPQLADDSIAVIWTMVERHDTESQWAPFWQSLPQTLHSGLSMSENLLQTLQGTSAYAECTGARQHIKDQYEALKPILCALVAAYPAHFEAAWFTWEAYLWAVQLWYAYAMQVQWSDGSRKECLVPYASLLNHSIYPHIVKYGQLDASSHQLCFPLFRPASKGEECFLSYGPLSNLKLMLFYGMAIPDNPYDVVHIEFEARDDHLQNQAQELLQSLKLPLQHEISAGPLPVSLQMTAAVLGMTPDTLKSRMWGGRKLDIEESSERHAIYRILVPILMDMQQQFKYNLSMVQALQKTGANPMLNCISTYLDGQMEIVDIVLSIAAAYS